MRRGIVIGERTGCRGLGGLRFLLLAGYLSWRICSCRDLKDIPVNECLGRYLES